MYSSEKAQSIVKKDVVYLSAGIQENVSFMSARVGQSPLKKVNYLELKFEKDDRTVVATLWEPKRGTKTLEEYEATCTNQFSRIDQILACFYTKEERAFSGATFVEFANWVADMLNNADKTKKVRLKVVYNDNGFTDIPNLVRYTFIEPMTVDKKDSVIIELNSDKFTKPTIVADKEQSNNNPLDNSIPQAEAEQLPF